MCAAPPVATSVVVRTAHDYISEHSDGEAEETTKLAQEGGMPERSAGRPMGPPAQRGTLVTAARQHGTAKETHSNGCQHVCMHGRLYLGMESEKAGQSSGILQTQMEPTLWRSNSTMDRRKRT